MSCVTVVPSADSQAVRKLLTVMGTNKVPVRVKIVVTSRRSREGYCFMNVGDKVSRLGGRMQLGWSIWLHRGNRGDVLIEAEPHAVYDPGKGQPWIDVTPHTLDGISCKEILFIPNDESCNPKTTVVNDLIRVPLIDDPALEELIRISSEKHVLRDTVRREWRNGRLIWHYSPEQAAILSDLEFRIDALFEAVCR